MTDQIAFRILDRDDIELMRGLNAVFASAFEDPATYLGAPPCDDYLARLLGQPHFIAVAATIDGTVAGGLAAYRLDKFERQRSEIYIYDLAVDARYRRRGIASGTIRALQAEAARHGAYVIFVQADLQDTPAIALYEKFGTRETALHFDIMPDDATTQRC
jgi:aminoglycoside 3-N-acetyltransferase I